MLREIQKALEFAICGLMFVVHASCQCQSTGTLGRSQIVPDHLAYNSNVFPN